MSQWKSDLEHKASARFFGFWFPGEQYFFAFQGSVLPMLKIKSL